MSDPIYSYAISKEVNGVFLPTGETFKGTADEVNQRLADLTAAEGGCYSADSGKGQPAPTGDPA